MRPNFESKKAEKSYWEACEKEMGILGERQSDCFQYPHVFKGKKRVLEIYCQPEVLP